MLTADRAVTLKATNKRERWDNMWKAFILASMGFLLALTAKGAEGNESQFLHRLDGPIKKSISVEIRGKLRKVVETVYLGEQVMKDKRFPMPTIDYITITRWEITVHGKTYELELGTKELQSLAEKLVGRTVLLEGRLETRWREKRVPTGPDGIRLMIAYPPVPV